MRIITKRIISIIVIALMLLSSLTISTFAAEEDIQSEASASTASYKYSTCINRIYYDYGTFESDSIITSPFSTVSTDAPCQVDCFSELFKEGLTFNKLRVYGWFLTNGGVRKYAVKITQGDKTLEYDVHNYLSEAKQDGVTNKAIKDGLYDFDHNAIYDIDVYLDDFDSEGDYITITLLAYSRYGEIFEVWKFSNVSVWDEVSLSGASTSYCRYCWAPLTNWVYSDPYSHRNCGIEYVCTCGIGNTFVMPLHSMTEIDSNGNAYCKTCSISESFTKCNIVPLSVSCAPFNEDEHAVCYRCDIDTEGWAYAFDCGDVCILEPHNFENGTCLLCDAHVHEWNIELVSPVGEADKCTEYQSRCIHCDEWNIWYGEHSFKGGCICQKCFYEKEHVPSVEKQSDYLFDTEICYTMYRICCMCKIELTSRNVYHTFIDDVCTQCNYAYVPEPEPGTGEPGSDTENEIPPKAETKYDEQSSNKFTDFLDNVKSKAAPLIALFILVDVLIAGYVIWKGLKKLSKR